MVCWLWGKPSLYLSLASVKTILQLDEKLPDAAAGSRGFLGSMQLLIVLHILHKRPALRWCCSYLPLLWKPEDEQLLG